jgi:urease accessory protein
MAVVAAFAIFHGHAHGTELPAGGSIAAFAAGFVLATALLHAAGVTLGLMIGRFSEAYGRVGFRLSGGLVALAGGAILLHAI